MTVPVIVTQFVFLIADICLINSMERDLEKIKWRKE
jgi:hypothetical protein